MKHRAVRPICPEDESPSRVKTVLAGLVMVGLVVTCPLVDAASVGVSAASINWASVSIQAGAQTSFDVFDAYGDVQVDANLNGTTSEVRVAQSHHGQDSNINAVHDAIGGGRSVHLSATTDLVSAQLISSQVSNSSQYAGSFLDNSSAQQWIYVVLHGDGKLNVQADYQLSVDGSVTDPNHDSAPDLLAWASVGVFDEGSGTYYSDAQMALKDPTLAPSSGRFDLNIVAPTERVLRLFFETTARSTVSSSPVPLPASLPLLIAGLSGMVLTMSSARAREAAKNLA